MSIVRQLPPRRPVVRTCSNCFSFPCYSTTTELLTTFSFLLYVLVCGGFIVRSFGNITSPNYPSNYDDMLNCKWQFQVPSSNRIMFQFYPLFSTELGYDRVSVAQLIFCLLTAVDVLLAFSRAVLNRRECAFADLRWHFTFVQADSRAQWQRKCQQHIHDQLQYGDGSLH